MFPKSVVFASILCCITFDGRGADGADVNIICPAIFKDNTKNTITCVINSTAIANANCAVPPTQVNFNLKKQNEQSSSSACFATYPCTTPSILSTSTTCICTKKTPAGITTYTFLFAANKTLHEKGTFTCTVCAGSVIDGQENCDSLNFDSDDSCETKTWSIVLIVVAQVVLVPAITVAIYFYVHKNIQWTDCCKIKAFVIGLVLTSVVVVTCMAVAFTCGCKNFPEDDPCYCLCVVVIVFAVLDVVVDVIIGIFIFVRKYPGCENKFLLLLCAFFALRIVVCIIALIVYIVRLYTKETSPPPTPSSPPPVTITSKRCGESKTSYELKWTVPATDDADIDKFVVKYIQVKGDTACEPVKPIETMGKYNDPPIEVDGKSRSTTLKSLSADTFYQVKMTVIKKTGSSEGSPFVFKTAK